MSVKTPIEVKMISWFAQAPPADAKKQFDIIRSLLLDRRVLGRKGQASAKAVKPARVASGTLVEA